MKYLSAISIMASMLYLYVGLNTYKLNKKSKECRIFLRLNIVMSIWSFAYAFAYTAENNYVFLFWNKLSAIGWCSFPAFVLYLVFTITNYRFNNRTIFKIIIFLPACVFLFMTVFLFGTNINTSEFVSSIFNYGFSVYNYSYLLLSILLILLWGKKSKSYANKKQSKIIVIASSIAFLLDLCTHIFLTLFDVPFVSLGQLYSLITLGGIYYVIMHYQFMQIPSAQITKQLFNEIMDLTFLIDPNGTIKRINKQVYELLKFDESELINLHITNIIKDDAFADLIHNGQSITKQIVINDIIILSKTGVRIPINISISPLMDFKREILLGILIVGQDISLITEQRLLQKKIAKSEEMLKKLMQAMPDIVIVTDLQGNITFLNKNENFLGYDFQDVHSSINVASVVIKRDIDRLIENREKMFLYDLGPIEYTVIKKDGSFVDVEVNGAALRDKRDEPVGLIFVIRDIMDRKKDQEKLGKSNEEIEKMNRELLKINTLLHEKSIRDSLTNLYNNYHINELLELEIRNANNYNNNLCLMMLDIDFFKNVNDNFGHQTGDKVLVTLSNLIRMNVREMDLVGRYGGEEFIIIFPQIDVDSAYEIANQVRLRIQNFDFGLDDFKVTVSAGLTQYKVESSKAFVKRADTLLYHAKEKGRNRIEIDI